MRGRAKYTSEREAKHVADKYVDDPKKPKKRVIKRPKKADTAPPPDSDPIEDAEPQTVEELLAQRKKAAQKNELKAFLERERQEKMPLTDKQWRFVIEYCIDQNGTQAALRAGFAKNSAASQASSLLRKPNIVLAIRKEQEKIAKRTGFDADRVLNILADQVLADVADLYDDEGNIKDIKEWPMAFRQGLVKKVTTNIEYEKVDGKRKAVGRITAVEIHDRKSQLQLIGRHIGIQAFSDTRRPIDDPEPDEQINRLQRELAGNGLQIQQPTGTHRNEPKTIDGTVTARTSPKGLSIKE